MDTGVRSCSSTSTVFRAVAAVEIDAIVLCVWFCSCSTKDAERYLLFRASCKEEVQGD